MLSDEQKMVQDAARSWAAEKAPVSRFRKWRDKGSPDGYDRALWRDMAEMGWAGIVVPEEFGGAGQGYRTLGLVLEETGRTLTATPLLSTALVSATALLAAGSEAQKREYLPRLAEGKLTGALAIEERAHHDPDAIGLKAARRGSGWVLSGQKTYVADGGAADVFVVAARTAGAATDAHGITLFLVPRNAAGLNCTALKTVDSRGAASLAFTEVEVHADAVLGTVDGGHDSLERILDAARAGLAAEMLGAATQSFEVTLDYLKTRTQFGQVIGTFQALQHRAAKMFTELELARSCVYAALAALDEGEADRAQLCSLAKARAGEAWHLVSNEMVQMHGGIGMTDAHDAGLYLKRARVAEALYGGSAFHRDRYARLMGF